MRPSNVDEYPSNDRYEDDIRYAIEFCYWFLKPIGIYPFVYHRTNRLQKIASAILILLCVSVLQFVNVPFGYYILFCEKDINAKVKFIGPLVFCMMSLFKYGYLGMKGSELGRCIEHMERDWRVLHDQDHRDVMLRQSSMARNLMVTCAIFLYTGGLSYHTIMPLVSGKKFDGNFTVRPITYPGYETFFDIQQSPTYEIVYCMHCLYVFVTGNITMTEYSLAAIFTTHACGQIRIQSLRLESLRKEGKEFEKAAKDCLALVVRDHVHILRFTKNVEDALHKLLLTEVIVYTLLICLLEYYCMMEWKTNDSIGTITYVAILTSFISNILIFCYVGELLLGQGNEIAAASYDTEWYNLPGRKARDIVLLLAISKHPPKLTAGKVLVLSLATFGDVLKSSLVYLNMLRTVTEF